MFCGWGQFWNKCFGVSLFFVCFISFQTFYTNRSLTGFLLNTSIYSHFLSIICSLTVLCVYVFTFFPLGITVSSFSRCTKQFRQKKNLHFMLRLIMINNKQKHFDSFIYFSIKKIIYFFNKVIWSRYDIQYTSKYDLCSLYISIYCLYVSTLFSLYVCLIFKLFIFGTKNVNKDFTTKRHEIYEKRKQQKHSLSHWFLYFPKSYQQNSFG